MIWHLIALLLFAAAAVLAAVPGPHRSWPIALIAAGLAVLELAALVT